MPGLPCSPWEALRVTVGVVDAIVGLGVRRICVGNKALWLSESKSEGHEWGQGDRRR